MTEEWLARQRFDASLYPRLALRGAFTVRVNIALRWIGSGKKVLDIGAGDGSISERIRMEGNAVTAFDFPEALSSASRYPGLVLRTGEAHKLPFEDGSFDTVFSGELIEHYEDPAALVKEWSRVLKQGGTLVITTPDGKEASMLHVTHRIWFTRRSLAKLLTGCGLKVRRAQVVAEQKTLMMEGVKP